MRRTTLNKLLQQKNIATILQVLYLEKTVSRAKIATLTGIAPSTASALVDKLEKVNLVEYLDEPRESSAVGRPPLMVRMNPKALFAIGLDVGLTKTKSLILGFDGTIIAKHEAALNARTDPCKALSSITEFTQQLILASGLELTQIIGLGISFRGLIDRERGVVNRTTSVPEWKQTHVVDVMQKKFAFPIFIENNANAFVLGEARFGAGHGKKNIFGTIVEEGIGSGIMINGHLYTGHHSAAGEFGHMIIMPSGPICHCGNTGCLRTMASESAIEAAAIRIVKAGVSTTVSSIETGNSRITARDVVEAAEKGDSVCNDIIEKAAQHLGIGLVNIVNIFSPEMIVFSKSLLTTYEGFIKKVTQEITERAYSREIGLPTIAISSLRENPFCIGAGSVVIDRVRGIH